METKRTPLLETLLQNVARLCVQLVAAGPPVVLTIYPKAAPVGTPPDRKGVTLSRVFHRSVGRRLWKTPY